MGVAVNANYDKDRPTSAALAGEEGSQCSAEIHTSTQSKPEPTSLNTMPAKGTALGDISVLVFVSKQARMSLFCVHTFLFVLCVCAYVSVHTCLSK